jgi:acetoin utilization deacetylase AcuC-like enzyme
MRNKTDMPTPSDLMAVYHSDSFTFPLPEGHRFPANKYPQLRLQLLERKILNPEQLFLAEAAQEKDLLLVHTGGYLERLKLGTLSEKEIRRMGLPWSPELVERSRRSVGGTIAACFSALENGHAANLGGGTHHAHPDFGSGFCVFNDTAVAARVVQHQQLASQILILDCDVHQGDGTAAIFRHDPSVFTFSIHCENNFPFRKEAGDLDIPLMKGVGDQGYLAALNSGVKQALSAFPAELVIYIAGADPFEDDRYGQLKLSKPGLAERDRLVYSKCSRAGLPVATVLGGGYARILSDVVDINCQTLQLAQEIRAT